MLRSYGGLVGAPKPNPEFPAPTPYYKANLVESYGEKLLCPRWDSNPPITRPHPSRNEQALKRCDVGKVYYKANPRECQRWKLWFSEPAT